MNRRGQIDLFTKKSKTCPSDLSIKTIGKHINNALHEELDGESVGAKFATTAADGKTYQVEYYNLDMIMSVGYRVKSISECKRLRQQVSSDADGYFYYLHIG